MEPHIQEMAIAYYEAVGGAHALSAAILLRYREYDQIALKTIDPKDFVTSDQYYRAILAVDFLRKYPGLPTSWDRLENTLESWWASEKSCYKTNYLISRCSILHKTSVAAALFDDCRKEMSRLLGRIPKELDFKFGPGATFSMPKKLAALLNNKIASQPEMTIDAWPFLRSARNTGWFRRINDEILHCCPLLKRKAERSSCWTLSQVLGNRFVTVPKDSTKDRPIAIEPSFNVFIQKGLGNAIRKSLNRHGLLLETSQDIHKKLARKGSLTGELATIDLSSASDSIAFELVKALLPTSWFEALNSVRSPVTALPKIDPKTGNLSKEFNWVHLEKFSSMGNASTFELETALFAGIVLAVAKQFGVDLITGENFSVYGDDIIVPTSIANHVITALSYVGFKTNTAKTFVSSEFRESCGGDYFHGKPVRAIRIDSLCDGPMDFYALHNKLRRVVGDDPKVLGVVLRHIPERYRRYGGPEHLGDIVLHGVKVSYAKQPKCVDTVHTPLYDQKWYDIRWIHTLAPEVVNFPQERWDEATIVASALYGSPSSGLNRPVEGAVKVLRVATLIR